MPDMQTPGCEPGECGSHDVASDNRQHNDDLIHRQAPRHLTLSILGGGSMVRVHVYELGYEPKVAVIPVGAVPALIRALVQAEVGT